MLLEDVRLRSLLLEALRKHYPLWQAKLVTQRSIILVSKLNTDCKLLHTRSLQCLLSIMRHISTKHTSNALLLVSTPCFKSILPILHLLMLFLKNGLKLFPLIFILLRLRNLSFRKSATSFNGETLAEVVNISIFLIFHGRKLPSESQTLLFRYERHSLSASEFVHINRLGQRLRRLFL